MSEPRYFEGVIQDGKIYERKFNRETPQIGVIVEDYDTLARDHEALITSYNEYQETLIKHGLIKVPLTAEEKLEKAQEQVQRLLDICDQQNSKIDALTEQVSKLTESSEVPKYEPKERVDMVEDGRTIEPDNEGSRQRDRSNRKKFRQVGRKSN